MVDISILGTCAKKTDFVFLQQCSDGCFEVGKSGVDSILATLDRKVEFIFFSNHVLAYVKSALIHPAYYPVLPTKIEKPIKAVLMDLDGTSVHSESFWIWIIQKTVASLLNSTTFELDKSDLPHVSGHSVSEHLQYAIKKYCPQKTVEEARAFYFQHAHYEMKEITEGRGKVDAFRPTPGLKEFLYELKAMGVKIGLVTSGLYEKAWPEICSAFHQLDMGDPKDFYDAIITGGFPLRKGEAGTLGELSPKPHPWLYSETARIGLGIETKDRHRIIGIEDSGAGVCSIRLGGYSCIGFAGGNILESGTKSLCTHYCSSFEEILALIK